VTERKEKYARVSELPSNSGQIVRVRGWVTHVRSSGKVAFAVIRDGTGIFQAVFVKNSVSPETAIYFVPERRLQRRVLARLIRRGVIVQTEPDTYYIDVPAYDHWRRHMRRRAALLIGGVGVLAAIAGLLA